MEIAARERGVFQLRLRLQRCERLRPRLALRVSHGRVVGHWNTKALLFLTYFCKGIRAREGE